MAGVGRRTASHVSKTAKRVAPGRRWGPPALSAPSLLSCFGAGTVVGCLKNPSGPPPCAELKGESSRDLYRSGSIKWRNCQGLTELRIRDGSVCVANPRLSRVRLRRVLHLAHGTLLEIRMVQQIESFRHKLDAHPLIDFHHPGQVQINVINTGSAE